MNCPRCQEQTKVTDSRPREDGMIRRRRVCMDCEYRFTTFEGIVPLKQGLAFEETWRVMNDYELLAQQDRSVVRRMIEALLISTNIRKLGDRRIA